MEKTTPNLKLSLTEAPIIIYSTGNNDAFVCKIGNAFTGTSEALSSIVQPVTSDSFVIESIHILPGIYFYSVHAKHKQ